MAVFFVLSAILENIPNIIYSNDVDAGWRYCLCESVYKYNLFAEKVWIR